VISIQIDRDLILQLCSEASFERGVGYFEDGRVEIREANPSRVIATVIGTDDYTVEVDLGDELSATCDCPYDYGGYCKHIVATLLEIEQELRLDPGADGGRRPEAETGV